MRAIDLRLLGAALAAALVVSCGAFRTEKIELPPPVHPQTPEHLAVKRGHEIYHSYCAVCHGINGDGDGPVAPDLRVPPGDVTHIAARRGGDFPEYEIIEFIDGRRSVPGHGTREMPVWGRWFSERVAGGEYEQETRARFAEIVAYLKTIQVSE